jgi:pyruvate-formate lyase-activating enzyme
MDKYTFGGRLTADFPSQINVDVTERCNLACIHCGHAAFKRGPLYSGTDMSEAIHNKLVEEVAAAGPSLQYVRYTAEGEPLLHPRIYDFLGDMKQRGKTTVSLTSNGLLLDAKAAGKLFDTGVDVVDISLDGFSAEAYERIRLGGKRQAVYDNVCLFLAERTRLNLPTKIAVSFIEQAENAGETDDFKQFWEGQGADFVIIRRLHSLGGTKKELAATKRAELFGHTRRPCLYPWERVCLSPKGKLKFCPCSSFAEFAEFAELSIADSWQNIYMKSLRQAHTDNNFSPQFAHCGQCPDWAATRWPHEGRSFADMVADFKTADVTE